MTTDKEKELASLNNRLQVSLLNAKLFVIDNVNFFLNQNRRSVKPDDLVKLAQTLAYLEGEDFVDNDEVVYL